MTFPVYLRVGGLMLHPHPVLEALGYFCGARLYFYQRRKYAGPVTSFDETAWVFIGCIFGALLGSKLLAWAESPSVYWAHRDHPEVFIGGKSIVGGLLGGWLGVEIAKRALGRSASLGDAFVFPLILGTAIGRVGCFLTGLSDDTYGTPTSLPWGVDFGDHLRRHPTQLYESAFVLLFGAVLLAVRRRLRVPGELFRAYLAGYFAFRVLVEFIKPREILVAGLSAIQVAALAGFIISLTSWGRLRGAAESAPPLNYV
jgi:phosphatidylglycerol---prolipoprotein diacylglyceryl transferase